MNLVADESVDSGITEGLRKKGINVFSIAEESGGIKDTEVLELAVKNDALLITEDKDFGELVHRLKKPAYGIVFLRFEVHERHLKWPRLKQLIDRYEGRLKGHFVVVDNEKFRFRPLKAY